MGANKDLWYFQSHGISKTYQPIHREHESERQLTNLQEKQNLLRFRRKIYMSDDCLYFRNGRFQEHPLEILLFITTYTKPHTYYKVCVDDKVSSKKKNNMKKEVGGQRAVLCI